MRVATDIGGTFTDLVAVDDQGKTILTKSHTTPPNFEEGVIKVIQKSGVCPQEIDRNSDFRRYPEAGTERSGIQGTLCQSRRGACSEFVYPQAPSASESGKTAGTVLKGKGRARYGI